MQTRPTYNRRKSNIFLNFKQFFFAEMSPAERRVRVCRLAIFDLGSLNFEAPLRRYLTVKFSVRVWVTAVEPEVVVAVTVKT